MSGKSPSNSFWKKSCNSGIFRFGHRLLGWKRSRERPRYLGHRRKGRIVKNLANWILRKAHVFGLVAAIGLFSSQAAQAQYGTSFYYSNPRTGFSYSQNVGVGNHSAFGGFSATTNGRNYSAGSGYYGHSHYQHQHFSSPQNTYSYRSNYGPGYSNGRTYYDSRCR